MKLLLFLVVVFSVTLMIVTVVLYNLLGWPSFVVMLVLLVVGLLVLKSLAGKFLEKAFTAPFAMKGKVLKDATTQVHSVEAASRPARVFDQDSADGDTADGEDDEDDEDEDYSEEYARYYTVDVTVSPQPSGSEGGFTMWEPGELVLVNPQTPSGVSNADEGEVGQILNVHLWEDGKWTEDDGIKTPGPQRLKLLVGVQDGVNQCRFRYYFEVFGTIDLPAN